MFLPQTGGDCFSPFPCLKTPVTHSVHSVGHITSQWWGVFSSRSTFVVTLPSVPVLLILLSPSYRDSWWHWARPYNPELSPHIKLFKFVTSGKYFSPCWMTVTASGDQGLDVWGWRGHYVACHVPVTFQDNTLLYRLDVLGVEFSYFPSLTWCRTSSGPVWSWGLKVSVPRLTCPCEVFKFIPRPHKCFLTWFRDVLSQEWHLVVCSWRPSHSMAHSWALPRPSASPLTLAGLPHPALRSGNTCVC